MNKWHDVWERRQPASEGSGFARLLQLNGYDNLGCIAPAAWTAYVMELMQRLEVKPGDSVFDVGCGAGAFLWPLRDAGHPVGGIDYAAGQIAAARQAMPDVDDLRVEEAAKITSEPIYDAVVSCGCFLYFPDLDYARQVIEGMAKKSRRCLGLFDLPDAASHDAALRVRRSTLGAEAYAQKYAGLDHLYFERTWVQTVLHQFGYSSQVEQNFLPGYLHAPYRFHVYAWRDPLVLAMKL